MSEPVSAQGEATIWSWLLGGLPQRVRRHTGADHLASALTLAERLVVESGEAQAVSLARELADTVRRLDDGELRDFFEALAEHFGPDEAALRTAAKAYADDPDQQRAAALHDAAEPRRRELLRRLNMAEGATALIVQLREKALHMSRSRPAVARLERDMHQLLAVWFNRGFLRLERIGWDSPAALLENIIRYEAVHEIRDWGSLRSRLQGNRRCLGFFHPAMPGIPLIFVEVALTMEMSGVVAPLLADTGGEAVLAAPTNAIFYSINNCHAGLKGINLGDLLIKQVVLELRTEFPSLTHFATLSPIPGLARWLAKAGESGIVPSDLREMLAEDGWHLDPERTEALREPLMRLCAEYLTGRAADGGDPRVNDPVARFHLTNGARLERINWLADLSPKGLSESCGLMVNYRYRLDSIEANHRAFLRHGRVAASSAVSRLLGPRGRTPVLSRLNAIGFRRTAPEQAAGSDG